MKNRTATTGKLLLLVCFAVFFADILSAAQLPGSQDSAIPDFNRSANLTQISLQENNQPTGSIYGGLDEYGLEEKEYMWEVAGYLSGKEYDALERTAREARSSQARFPGGAWKLWDFYYALGEPMAQIKPTDAEWRTHIASLKAWELARPESVTARIALAQAYETYGQQARGTGYAGTVSDTGWKLQAERYEMAASILAEAAKLKEKCPYWFEAVQEVAITQGWEKARARKLLDEAVAFQPHYYHYYREYANFLLPKWYGEPGEAEALAEEVSNNVPGPEGRFLYFEIASVIACCNLHTSELGNLSWPKVKEGYIALGQLYGYSNLKMNRFAYMAIEARDKTAAQQVFSLIGNAWVHKVWWSRDRFENARMWAAH